MSEAAAAGVRVLVVDDNVTVCRTTATTLARAGFQVFTAVDGRLAIEQARETPPEVAVVDLAMPTISGYEVMRALRETHGDAVHLIAMTGDDSAHMRRAALEATCDDFVTKPTSGPDLQMRVAIAARRQRAVLAARLSRESTERQHVFNQEAIALLAHDLRNTIMGCATTLSIVADLEELDADTAELVRASTGSLRLMSTLVANLLDIERFEDAAVRPTVKLVDVRVLLESVVAIHGAITPSTGFEIDCAPNLTARFDAGLIERVLHNLVGNARRYAGTGGLVRIIAHSWYEVPSGSIEIAVENSGPPVDDRVVGQLFTKYARGPDGKRGLGLFFCRLACEAHGGAISYATVDGRPRFVVELPGLG